MKQRRGPGKQAAIYAPRLLPPRHHPTRTRRTAAPVAILVLLSAWTARVPALASTLPDFSGGAGCERSGGISHGNAGVCALWAPPQAVPTTPVISSRRQRRGARGERQEPVNEQFLYRVPGPAEAAGVVRRLDVLPPDRLVGLAVIARGYGEDPEEFYVFANTEDLSEGERALIVDTFTAFGTPTALTIQHLARGTPRPHLFASGDVSTIIPTLLAHYPGVPGSPR